MKVAIGYSSDNKNQITKLIDFFNSFAGIEVTEFESSESLVSKKLLEFDGNKIMVITDNFLKSEQCMFGGLELISHSHDNLLILLADGVDENSNSIPTSLSKVTHIIKYINFWQDRYLELRKEKTWDETENDNHLQRIRSISTEVGEFIRLLRGVELIDMESEVQGGFINLRNFMNLSSSNLPFEDQEVNESETTQSRGEGETTSIEEEHPEHSVGTWGEGDISGSEEVKDPWGEGETTSIEEEHQEHSGGTWGDGDISGSEEVKDPWGESETTNSDDVISGEEEQEDWIIRAEEEIKAGNFSEAESFLKRAEFNSSHDSNILFRLSMLYFQHFKNDLDLALQYIDRAIHLEEDNGDLYFHRAMIKDALRYDSDAITGDLSQALELVPNHALAMYQLAVINKKQENLNDARNYYLKAVQLNAEFKTVQNDLAFGITKSKGEVYEIIEDLKKQINHLQQIIDFKETPIQKKTVLITGATSGIGRATALKFAAAGFRKIIITGRRKNLLNDLKDEILKISNAEVLDLCFDVTKREEVEQALKDIPNIDILINNAGKAKGLAPIHEGSFEHWEEMIQTNISGLLYVTRIISQQMVNKKSGHIVNVGSTAGKEVYPNGNVYCASKFAVDALTKSMRLDLYQHQIRVSQISPGHVENTEFAKVRFDGDEDKAKIYEGFNPLTSSDVADMILYIVNQPARINIQDIVVMGTQQAGALFIDRSGRKF